MAGTAKRSHARLKRKAPLAELCEHDVLAEMQSLKPRAPCTDKRCGRILDLCKDFGPWDKVGAWPSRKVPLGDLGDCLSCLGIACLWPLKQKELIFWFKINVYVLFASRHLVRCKAGAGHLWEDLGDWAEDRRTILTIDIWIYLSLSDSNP